MIDERLITAEYRDWLKAIKLPSIEEREAEVGNPGGAHAR